MFNVSVVVLWNVYVDEESVGLQQKQPHGLKEHVVFQDQKG